MGLPEVHLRVFILLQQILSIETRDRAEDKFVMYLISLQMTGLSSAMRECTKLSIETLSHMLQRCLQPVPDAVKQYVTTIQLNELPSYLFDTPPTCISLYFSNSSALTSPQKLYGCLVYLPLFLLPTIMTLSQA